MRNNDSITNKKKRISIKMNQKLFVVSPPTEADITWCL
jgi:hypothetical protein